MSAVRQPAIFIPHGGGPCFWIEFPPPFGPHAWDRLRDYLSGLVASLPERPKAFLVVTAHWEAAQPTVSVNAKPGMLFDYYGFPEHTYKLSYPAPGDNPFSESQFKTLKYRPDFPGRFDSIEAARRHCQTFFAGTTTITVTAGWACTLPPTSTTAPPRPSATSAPPCSPTHTGCTPNGSSASRRAATPAHRLVDQPTRPARGDHSLNTARRCLIQVDSFRSASWY